jgi:hypothetical protein
MAGPERGDVADLHCFCEIILMDEPEAVSIDNLEFLMYFAAASQTPQ